jgi:hypothetical protein
MLYHVYFLIYVALENVIRDSELETKGTIYNKSTQILAYIDDILLAGDP